jgi:hypothetical protein
MTKDLTLLMVGNSLAVAIVMQDGDTASQNSSRKLKRVKGIVID